MRRTLYSTCATRVAGVLGGTRRRGPWLILVHREFLKQAEAEDKQKAGAKH